MPVIMFTAGEIAEAAHHAARTHAEEIQRLADLERTPLAPGESADERRHKIASLGKKLADAFITLDDIMKSASEDHHAQHAAHAPDKDDKEAN